MLGLVVQINLNDMNQLIKNLCSFDRKERFAVFREVFFQHDQIEYPLSSSFLEKLKECIDVEFIPSKVFCATDYHLDWIEAALLLGDKSVENVSQPLDISNDKFNTNQQDIDLLIAFEDYFDSESTHVVLIEAKAYTHWNKEQLASKTKRLHEVFDKTEQIFRRRVKPYFVLMTNEVSKRIDKETTKTWSRWMKNDDGEPNWLTYCLPERRQIRRCSQKTHPSGNGLRIYFRGVP